MDMSAEPVAARVPTNEQQHEYDKRSAEQFMTLTRSYIWTSLINSIIKYCNLYDTLRVILHIKALASN